MMDTNPNTALDRPEPALVSIPQDRWDQRLKANELRALMEFLSRASLHGTEAMPFVQLQTRLSTLLSAEERG